MTVSTERAEGTLLAPKTTSLRIRQFELLCDKPPGSGGTDRGPMASEYLLAALVSCTLTTAHRIAGQRGVKMTLRAEAEMDFDDRGEMVGFRLIQRVQSEAARRDVETVLRLSERACTISKILGQKPERTVIFEAGP